MTARAFAYVIRAFSLRLEVFDRNRMIGIVNCVAMCFLIMLFIVFPSVVGGASILPCALSSATLLTTDSIVSTSCSSVIIANVSVQGNMTLVIDVSAMVTANPTAASIVVSIVGLSLGNGAVLLVDSSGPLSGTPMPNASISIRQLVGSNGGLVFRGTFPPRTTILVDNASMTADNQISAPRMPSLDPVNPVVAKLVMLVNVSLTYGSALNMQNTILVSTIGPATTTWPLLITNGLTLKSNSMLQLQTVRATATSSCLMVSGAVTIYDSSTLSMNTCQFVSSSDSAMLVSAVGTLISIATDSEMIVYKSNFNSSSSSKPAVFFQSTVLAVATASFLKFSLCAFAHSTNTAFYMQSVNLSVSGKSVWIFDRCNFSSNTGTAFNVQSSPFTAMISSQSNWTFSNCQFLSASGSSFAMISFPVNILFYSWWQFVNCTFSLPNNQAFRLQQSAITIIQGSVWSLSGCLFQSSNTATFSIESSPVTLTNLSSWIVATNKFVGRSSGAASFLVDVNSRLYIGNTSWLQWTSSTMTSSNYDTCMILSSALVIVSTGRMSFTNNSCTVSITSGTISIMRNASAGQLVTVSGPGPFYERCNLLNGVDQLNNGLPSTAVTAGSCQSCNASADCFPPLTSAGRVCNTSGSSGIVQCACATGGVGSSCLPLPPSTSTAPPTSTPVCSFINVSLTSSLAIDTSCSSVIIVNVSAQGDMTIGIDVSAMATANPTAGSIVVSIVALSLGNGAVLLVDSSGPLGGTPMPSASISMRQLVGSNGGLVFRGTFPPRTTILVDNASMTADNATGSAPTMPSLDPVNPAVAKLVMLVNVTLTSGSTLNIQNSNLVVTQALLNCFPLYMIGLLNLTSGSSLVVSGSLLNATAKQTILAQTCNMSISGSSSILLDGSTLLSSKEKVIWMKLSSLLVDGGSTFAFTSAIISSTNAGICIEQSIVTVNRNSVMRLSKLSISSSNEKGIWIKSSVTVNGSSIWAIDSCTLVSSKQNAMKIEGAVVTIDNMSSFLVFGNQLNASVSTTDGAFTVDVKSLVQVGSSSWLVVASNLMNATNLDTCMILQGTLSIFANSSAMSLTNNNCTTSVISGSTTMMRNASAGQSIFVLGSGPFYHRCNRLNSVEVIGSTTGGLPNTAISAGSCASSCNATAECFAPLTVSGRVCSTSWPTGTALCACAPGGTGPLCLPPSGVLPTSVAPSTSAPSTSAPTTNSPSTASQNTNRPSTSGPSTRAPSTSGPSTNSPSTIAPSTIAPSTAPSTMPPAASTTPPQSTFAPISPAPTTPVAPTANVSTEVPLTATPTLALSTAISTTSPEPPSSAPADTPPPSTAPLVTSTAAPASSFPIALITTEAVQTTIAASAPTSPTASPSTLSPPDTSSGGAPTTAPCPSLIPPALQLVNATLHSATTPLMPSGATVSSFDVLGALTVTFYFNSSSSPQPLQLSATLDGAIITPAGKHNNTADRQRAVIVAGPGGQQWLRLAVEVDDGLGVFLSQPSVAGSVVFFNVTATATVVVASSACSSRNASVAATFSCTVEVPAAPVVNAATLATAQTAAAMSIVASSVAGPAAASDMQSVIVVMLARCSAGSATRAEAYSLLTPFALSNTARGALGGNAVASAALLLVQLLVFGVARSNVRKAVDASTANMQACAVARLPGYSILLAAALHQSTLFSAIRLMGSDAVGAIDVLMGLVALLFSLALPIALLIASAKVPRRFVAYEVLPGSRFAAVYLKPFVPVGGIFPTQFRLMLSSAITSFANQSPTCVLFPFASSFVTNMVGVLPATSPTWLCSGFMYLSAAVHISLGIGIAVSGIHRVPLSRLLNMAGLVLTGIFHALIGAGSRSSADALVTAQCALSIGRSLCAILIGIVERRMKVDEGVTRGAELWRVGDGGVDDLNGFGAELATIGAPLVHHQPTLAAPHKQLETEDDQDILIPSAQPERVGHQQVASPGTGYLPPAGEVRRSETRSLLDGEDEGHVMEPSSLKATDIVAQPFGLGGTTTDALDDLRRVYAAPVEQVNERQTRSSAPMHSMNEDDDDFL